MGPGDGRGKARSAKGPKRGTQRTHERREPRQIERGNLARLRPEKKVCARRSDSGARSLTRAKGRGPPLHRLGLSPAAPNSKTNLTLRV
ncbi:hypothetical protein MRX96_027713 [Rhipicephalus microplus]